VKLFFTWEELEFFGPNTDMRYQYTYTSGPEVGSPSDALNVAGSPVVHLRQALSSANFWVSYVLLRTSNSTLFGINSVLLPRFGWGGANTSNYPTGAYFYVPTTVELSTLSYQGISGSTVCRSMVEQVPAEIVSEQVMF